MHLKFHLFSIIFSFTTILHAQEYDLISDYNFPTDGYGGSYMYDINQDGYEDILYADKRDIYLFINKANGKLEFEKIHLLKDQSISKTFQIWDFDNDGDLDIFIGLKGRIIQLENTSTENIIAFIKVTKNFFFLGVQYDETPEFVINYINADTLFDATLAYGKCNILYQLPDSTFFNFPLQNGDFSDIRKVIVEDIDADHQNDIIFSRQGETDTPGLFYFSNANATFTNQKILLTGDVKHFELIDTNGDDKKEILAIRVDTLSTFSYETNVTDSKFSKTNYNIPNLANYSTFALSNSDKNDSLKIFAGSDQKSPLTIFNLTFNENELVFEESLISDNEFITSKLHIADFDKDGDEDIIQMLDDNGFNIYNKIKISSTESLTQKTKIYPIPANDFIVIENNDVINSIKIIDLYGNIVFSRSDINHVTANISTSDIPGGMFFIEINTENEIRVYRTICIAR